MDDAVVATYLIETPLDPAVAAEALAGEQSSGTFLALPGETEALKRRHRAEVQGLEELESTDTPALPGSMSSAGDGVRYRRARLRVRFPFDNIGINLPTLLATVAGNLFELREFSGVRLIDFDLPNVAWDAYPGPQFSIDGTRRLAGVESGPIIGTIIKPSIGLSPAETAALVTRLAGAGIDFIKDDELMADPPHSPFRERVRAVMKAVDRHADRTGKKVMIAFNVSADLETMLRHHDLVLESGGTCIMASLNHVGLVAMEALRRHSQLPIHGHRNGWGMLTRSPMLGLDFRAYQKIWRLVGVDQLHVNGLRNKFFEEDASVMASIRACLAPINSPSDRVMPVVSSGQTVRQVPDTYRLVGATDVMFLAGGGIHGHPGGPEAGIASLRQAWSAAMTGESLEAAAARYPELRQALDTFEART